MGDESFIIILNSKCSKEKAPENLRSLFRYINESEVTSGDRFVETVHERVEALQESEEVKNVMTLEEEFRIRLKRAAKEAAKEAEAAAAVKEVKEAAEAEAERLGQLYEYLLDSGRLEDLKKALHDPEYRERLFKEKEL